MPIAKNWKELCCFLVSRKQLVFVETCISIALTIIIPHKVLAQVNSPYLTGIIADYSSKQPVEFANIQLFRITDGSILKSTATDRKGKFILEEVLPGNYTLSITFIGYAKNNINLTIGPNQQKTNLGTIEMRLLTTEMANVSVYAETPVLKTFIDRKIYNVSQEILAQSGTASDMLKNIPSVEVDIDGLVSLRGSQKLMILINGKPSSLTGKKGAETLQQLPANAIEQIEVITNPSAQYQPDGTAGIINIVLKKTIKSGWNGSATANIGNNDRFNGTVSFNVKTGKLNLFSAYSIRKDTRIRLTAVVKSYIDSTQNLKGLNTEHLRSTSHPVSHSLTIGGDYTLNDHNSLGFSNIYVNRKMIKQDVQNEIFYDPNKIVVDGYDRLRNDPENKREDNASIYWLHNFKKKGHDLRAEFNSSSSDEQEDNRYANLYYDYDRPSSFDNTLIKQSERQQQLAIHYSNALNKSSTIEIGYSGLFTQQDFDFYGEYFSTSLAKFLPDVEKTSQFLYKTSIHAFYSTYKSSHQKVSYDAGLRVEQAFQQENLVTKDLRMNDNYFKIYPTAHISYKLKTNEIQLSYSKRVNRPEGDDLNPFPKYRDPRNLQAGNPNLLPEVIHSLELGSKWQNEYLTFMPSIYYRYKRNGFTDLVVPLNDSVLLTTTRNLANDQSAGLELILLFKPGKFFSANLTSNFFNSQIDASNLGYGNKKSMFSMGTNFNSTFTITKTTRVQITFNYKSARLTPQGRQYPNFVLSTGIKQDLFKNKLSCSLTASDLFNSLQKKMKLNTSFLNQTSIVKRNSRIVYFGINYRFGKMKKKSGEEKLQFDNAF